MECVEAAADETHLAACADCRDTAAVVAVVARTSQGGAPDLWPRLAARLAADDVRLRLPSLGWQAIAALIAVTTLPLLAPEPGRLLAVMLGVL
jgi:hypothetical protein